MPGSPTEPAEQEPKTVGFIGLGVMGGNMARHVIRAGYRLRVFARARERARALLDEGAEWSDSPAALAAACDAVVTIVGEPPDVEDLYFRADGLLAGLRPRGVLVDMTTSSPGLAERIARAAAERGGGALDAPVSGGDRGAREASLSIMVGGEKADYDRARPLLGRMGRTIVHQGPAGSGQRCKLCNQIAIGGIMIGLCEALVYAEKAGLDPETVLQSISTGAAGSWAMTNLAPRILAGDLAPGFAVKHLVKDLRIAVESAAELGLNAPGLELAFRLYRRLAELHDGNEGTQALIRLFRG